MHLHHLQQMGPLKHSKIDHIQRGEKRTLVLGGNPCGTEIPLQFACCRISLKTAPILSLVDCLWSIWRCLKMQSLSLVLWSSMDKWNGKEMSRGQSKRHHLFQKCMTTSIIRHQIATSALCKCPLRSPTGTSQHWRDIWGSVACWWPELRTSNEYNFGKHLWGCDELLSFAEFYNLQQ